MSQSGVNTNVSAYTLKGFSHPLQDSEESVNSDSGPVYARIRPRGPRRVSTSNLSPVQLPPPEPPCPAKSSSEGNVSLVDRFQDIPWPQVDVAPFVARACATAKVGAEEVEKAADARERPDERGQKFEKIGGVEIETFVVESDRSRGGGGEAEDTVGIQRETTRQSDTSDANVGENRASSRKVDHKVCRQNALLESKDSVDGDQDVPSAPQPAQEIKRQSSSLSQGVCSATMQVRSDFSRQDSIQSSILAQAGSPPMTSQEHLLMDEVAASLAELDGMSEMSRSFFEAEPGGQESPPVVGSVEASKLRSASQGPELGDPELLPYSTSSSAVYTEVDFDVCGGINPMTSTPVTAVSRPEGHAPSDPRYGSPEASAGTDSVMTGSAEYAVIGPGRVCSVYETTLFVMKNAEETPSVASAEETSSAPVEEAAAVLTVSVEYATVGPVNVAAGHDSVQPPTDRDGGASASSGYSEPQAGPAQLSGTEPRPPLPPVTSQPTVTSQPASITSQPTTVTSETPDVSQSPPTSSQLSSLSPNPSPILCQPKRGGAAGGPSSSPRSVSWCLDESRKKTKSKSPTRRRPGSSATDDDSPSCLPNGSTATPAPLTEGQKRLGKVLQDLKRAEEGSNGYSLRDMAATGLSALSGGVKDVARVFSTPFQCCKRQVSGAVVIIIITIIIIIIIITVTWKSANP